MRRMKHAIGLLLLAVMALSAGGGCVSAQKIEAAPVPRELDMVTHPPYLVEAPDILQVDLIGSVPKPPYRIRPLDVVGVSASETLPDAPITGAFTVDPDGTVYLGAPYGSVAVAGLTIAEARDAFQKHLGEFLKKPTASVSLVQTRAAQQVRGPHLVRADGTIGLGTYGSVRVVGMTVPQVKRTIEVYLGDYFLNPEVSVDVVGFNSKVYYVIFDYGGAGQQITRLPLTGNETVLDGISQLSGLPAVSDGRRIWVSRRHPDGCPPQVLPVDWKGVLECGDSRTNYQLLAGDRVYVKANALVAADTRLARAIAPIERLFGIVLLGSSTVNNIILNPNNNGNNSGNTNTGVSR